MADLPASEAPVDAANAEISRFLRIGWTIVAVVFGGLVGWSVFAPFEGAVLTQGQVAVASNQQAVQHLEGGIVREIYVRESDQVVAGQKLISLDPTTVDAGVTGLEARLFELLGNEARLIAERDSVNVIRLRPAFRSLAANPEMAAILKAQGGLRETRSRERATRLAILRQRIEQLQVRIDNFGDEVTAKDAQMQLLQDEIEGAKTLVDKGLYAKPRYLALQRDLSTLSAARTTLISDTAGTRIQIGEARSEIAKLDLGYREQVLTELSDVQTQIGELTEERTAAVDRQTRLDILAPRAGRVLGVRAHTIGGVINAAEPIMYIVPDNDTLVAKVRVSPADIDKISVGQLATLRFTAFNQNQTPQFDGEVTRVSADALTDAQTGMVYFEAVVAIPPEAVTSTAFELLPGMPVDASLKTGQRSVLSYLVKPLTDSLSRTFRE
jgi:HlyD family type I secretion membrane fusion protein